MKLASTILLALSILAAPIVWHGGQRHFAAPPDPDALVLLPTVDALRTEVAALRSRLDALDARTALGLAARSSAPDRTAAAPPEPDALRDVFAQVVLIADRRSSNDGLTVATPRFLTDLLGAPREDLTDACQPVTNPDLQRLISTEDVGPISARMLRPALASLRQIFANVELFEPELYARVQSAGSLCARLTRGSESAASAHGFGLAVDINIDGALDELADGRTQLGLILLADFFRREGWIWGAGFSREDSMHFEVSREKLEQWRRQGLL